MRWPLRYQIMLPMAAIMLLTVIAVGGIGALLAVRATKARIASQIVEVTKILEESNFPLTDAVLRQMRALSGAELVLVDAAGKVVAASGAVQNMAPLMAADAVSNGESFGLGDRQWVRNQGYFHTTTDLAARQRGERSAVLHILYPEEEYRRAWQRAVYPSLGVILLALPVITLLSAVTANRISARVGRLQRQVENIARGDFKPMIVSERDDEIRALGEAVNRMAGMLAQYEQEVRGAERTRTLALLGGGIAHQMRNSATGCAMALDLHADECSLGGSCESLDVAKRQLRLMEEYLQRFLQLGKCPDVSHNVPFDLVTLVGELVPLVQPAARHAGIDLHWSHETAPISMDGEPQQLNQLVINLLLNAIEAAAQEKARTNLPARVAVALERVLPNRVLLSISDTGSGPDENIQHRLFEPFATNRPDGIGIGLAVARDIAARHGGKIDWQRMDGMTRFEVELPCEPVKLESELVYAASR